ncbi:MAG: hypothetical protein ACLQU4_12165 [Limisphaerales bacterium]
MDNRRLLAGLSRLLAGQRAPGETGGGTARLGFLIMCIGFWIKLQQEESLMLRHFPDEYSAYRKRVKALVPFII